MIGKNIQFNGKSVFLLLLVVLTMAVVAGPALADTAEPAVEESVALYKGGISAKEMKVFSQGWSSIQQRTDFLGREGGTLALLGVGQPNHINSSAVGAAGDTFTVGAVQNGQAGIWVVYTRTDYMGRDGGALALLDQR